MLQVLNACTIDHIDYMLEERIIIMYKTYTVYIVSYLFIVCGFVVDTYLKREEKIHTLDHFDKIYSIYLHMCKYNGHCI